MRKSKYFIWFVGLLFAFGGLSTIADGQGRPSNPGGGPPAGIPRGGPPINVPSGGGVDRGLVTASERSAGRSDRGLGQASESSGGRSDIGIETARARNNYPSDTELNRYRGIARRFDTTPEALRDLYLLESNANPRLNFGQFVAANVVAANLGSRYPNVTTEAILEGLRNGDSLGQTLRMLGVGETDVREAPRSARRQIKESRKQR